MNFERGGLLALPDTATVSAQPSIAIEVDEDEASVDQDQSVDDKVKVSDREARAQSPVGGVLYVYDIAQAQ
eukprot:scaffold16091_cov132-Skeletonema_dohrnii-CCMP3373.AAC.1